MRVRGSLARWEMGFRLEVEGLIRHCFVGSMKAINKFFTSQQFDY